MSADMISGMSTDKQMESESVTAPEKPQKKRSSSEGKIASVSDGPVVKKQKKEKAANNVQSPKTSSNGVASTQKSTGSALKESNKNKRKSDNKMKIVKADDMGKSIGTGSSAGSTQKENKGRRKSDGKVAKSSDTETKLDKSITSPTATKKTDKCQSVEKENKGRKKSDTKAIKSTDTDTAAGKSVNSPVTLKSNTKGTNKLSGKAGQSPTLKESKGDMKKVKETKTEAKKIDGNRKKFNKTEENTDASPVQRQEVGKGLKESKNKQDHVSKPEKPSKKADNCVKQCDSPRETKENNSHGPLVKAEKMSKKSALGVKSENNIKEKSESGGKQGVELKSKEKKSTTLKRQSSLESKSKKGLKDKNKVVEDESNTESWKLDKENIDANLPVGRELIQKLLPEMMPKLQGKKEKIVPEGKVASCKDITNRSLHPTARWGHSLCFVHKNLSVLIGGQGNKQQLNKDALWTLDTETRRWDEPEFQSESQKPEYRMGHTMTYDPMLRCIYVYGGSKNTRWFHDVHILDIEEWKWQLVKVSGKAPTRAYHSATLYRHELWVFGGVYPRPDPQPDGCSNDIHIFSPVMESWYNPIVKGEKPLPRSGHSATLLDDRLVIFGGWDAPISYSDLHILDMGIVEWTQPSITGTPPSPRSWHASCALSGNRVLIHGGYNGDFALDDTHIFNLDSLNWIQIKVENSPSARVGHKAVCMPYRHDNEEEDEVIIFGGGDNDGAYFDDLLSIYVPFEPQPVS